MAPPRQPLPTTPDPKVLKDTLDDFDDAISQLQLQARKRVGEMLAGRYELRNVLGAGGAGAVFSAFDHDSGERVAVKVLHAGLSQSKEHVARFEREARAAAAIGHSSVVKVVEVVNTRDELFMVLELLDGEALFYAIEERRLSLGDVLEVGRQLLGALAAAHARDIIHRDVKPENVFLCRDPSGAMRVKLLDFGIAKMLRRDLATSFSTLEGMVVGTPHYMSPQMCAGEPATPNADIWAAGAVLYHALAGRPPFDDDHIGRLLMRIVRDPAPSLSVHRPDLPAEIIDAIDKALAHDPDERWKSAHAFADALTAGGAPIDDLDY
jgi:serine/threonine-protein kinase